MALDLNSVNGYGDGSLGVITNPAGQINSYANVTAIGALGYQITIGTPSVGIYETFAVGKEIAIHVSAGNGTSTDTTYLGAKLHCKITAVSGSVLSIDKDFTAVLPTAVFANYQVQAITVAQFKSLTLSSGSITPPAYSVSNKYGGIILAKCTDTVTFSGGSINLVDKGIPVASTAYRSRTAQEINGTADTDKYAGWENHETLRKFLLNAGDGAAMIMAKHYVQTGTASRIGGTTAGAQFVRGTIGGSTIALVCGDMTGFDPSIISKTKGSGQGLGRCYIASDTKLRNDEGLYAYDCISNPYRLMQALNIKNYGDGSLGDITNPTVPLNNYAKIVAISADGKTVSYTNKTITGMAPISTGALVMFHISKHTDSADMSFLGKFIIAKVLTDDGANMVLDTAVTRIFDVSKLIKYNCQVISVAQFNNLTISTTYSATIAWNDTTKTGGICAIATRDTCDVSDGYINVNSQGGGVAYGREGLAFIGNAQSRDMLPLGDKAGSVFILSKKLKGNVVTRIGLSSQGNDFGGIGTKAYAVYTSIVYSAPGTAGGGYSGVGGINAGSGSGGGQSLNTISTRGGYGSKTGAHLFIVADKIDGLSNNNFSTSYAGNGYGSGGSGGQAYGPGNSVGTPGFGGGYIGGGGAGLNPGHSGTDFESSYGVGGYSSGWYFIYCNSIVSEDTTGVVI